MRLKSLIRMIGKTLYMEICVWNVFIWEINIWPRYVMFLWEVSLCLSEEGWNTGTECEGVCILFPFSRHSTHQALGMKSLKFHQSRLLQSRTPPWACLTYCYPFRLSAIRCLPREMSSYPSFPHKAWIFLPLPSQEIWWSKMVSFIAMGCIW